MYSENQLPSEREVLYYEERAKGGAALIFYGAMIVQARSRLAGDSFAFDERVIPGFRAIANAVHKHGTPIFGQLIHYGNQSLPGLRLDKEDWKPLLAPSTVPDGLIQEMPKEMEEEDFQAIREGYVSAAKNVKGAGMDGINITAGHASLLRQFLSPYSNKRTDEYGGSLENRMRYPLEVLEAVRKEVGDDFPIAVRLLLDEFLPNGLNMDETKKIARELESTGLVDLMIADLGIYTTPHIMNPPMAVPLGYAVYASAALKETIDIPVIGFGRITDPQQAEKILQDGHADLIGMARQLISDPETPKKIAEGRTEEIRICMGCNQGCFGRVWKNLTITCTQNPAAGREKALGIGTLKSAHDKKKVVVVGGGPGGMKAAEIASRRGHKVLLCEKQEELGGNVLLFSESPNRDNFIECVRYLRGQIEKLPIEVMLGQEADKGSIQSVNPDVVILACGAIPQIPPIAGVNLPHVGTVSDLLRGNLAVGESIAIFDSEGFWPAANAAQLLLNQEKRVQIVTPHPFVGMNIDLPSLFSLNLDVYSKGLVAIPNTMLKEIGSGYIETVNIWSGEERKISDVDTVIMATGYMPNDTLYATLRKEYEEVYRIGDCLAPRKVDNAIWDGEQIGRKI
jgi:mycofactocin system FadH/OYE family oxidoreductase 2